MKVTRGGKMIKTVKEDGVTVDNGFDAVGQLPSCQEILKALKGKKTAKLASAATHISEDTPKVEGVEAAFVAAPLDEKEKTDFFHFVFRVCVSVCVCELKEKLAKGEYVPSPRIQVVEGGLESTQKALDHLKKGVSGVKLVLEV